MVSTRGMTRLRARQVAFKLSYKGLTSEQQAIARHNRFLSRVWKVPRDKRQQHRTCVACLEDFLTGPQRSHMAIMACDHPIHLECFERHAAAYISRMKPLWHSVEELQAIPMNEYSAEIKKRSVIAQCGAPCPACRMPLPMRHVCVFS